MDQPQPERPKSHGQLAETLAEIASIFVQVRDTPVLSQRIVDELRSMFGTLGVMFCRMDPETKSLRAVAVSGDVGPEYDAHVVYAAGMGTPGLAVTEPKPVILSDVLHEARVKLTPEMRALISRAPFRAVLAVPIVLHSEIIGTLCMLDRPGRRFTDDEAWFAQAVAHQSALALENARLYEEAERLRVEAIGANQAKDVFLATLSHELRQLMNASFGWAKMLRGGQMDKATTERALISLERNAMLQTRLIDDVLDVSRIIAGKLTLSITAVQLSRVLEESVDSLRPQADEKGVTLLVEIEPNAGLVEGDPLRLHQIITNLVTNGTKFTPRGGQVAVRLERDGEAIRIVVTDTGSGIASDLLPHVFEPFRQQEVEQGRTGLGLGLTIVKRLVELHAGTVTAASPGLGLGAIFTVDLPVLTSR